MRLINADALIPMMKKATTDKAVGIFSILIGFNEIKQTIDEAPTIEAEPVRHGRWEDKKVAFYLKCSECGATVRKNLYDVFLDCDIRDLNYCPHCGARMYKEEL